MRIFGTLDKIMSKPPHIDRKELKTPDAFLLRGRAVMGFFMTHRKRFIPILIGAGIVLLGGYTYNLWDQHRIEKGWILYYEAMKLPADKPERWEKLKAGHEGQFRGRASLFAAVALADHYFDETKKETTGDSKSASSALAASWYEKALASSDLLAAERQLLLVNRGEAWELQRNLDEALKSYQAAVESGGEAKGLAMLSVARIYEAKRDKAKAVETYEKLAADFNNTEYAKTAKNYLRRLKSPLFSDTGL